MTIEEHKEDIDELSRLILGTDTIEPSEAFIRAIFEALPDAAMLWDSKGIVRMMNSQAELLTEYPRLLVLNKKHAEDFMPERFQEAHREFREEYMEHPAPRLMGEGRALYVQTRTGREVAVQISLAPCVTVAGILVITIMRRLRDDGTIQRPG